MRGLESTAAVYVVFQGFVTRSSYVAAVTLLAYGFEESLAVTLPAYIRCFLRRSWIRGTACV